MDKSRIYAVIGREKKAIYAVNKTELQATKIAERLKSEGIDDSAVVICNGASQLAHRRYDKYDWLVREYGDFDKRKKHIKIENPMRVEDMKALNKAAITIVKASEDLCRKHSRKLQELVDKIPQKRLFD